MAEGVIFDLKEFAVNDGPGIRLTVFFKGCPLRCVWCHNPEGLLFEPEPNKTTGRITGKIWTADALALHINNFRDLFNSSGGGVTFSGGEPTAQAEFLLELIALLPDIHKNLDTSGFCPPDIFSNIFTRCDLVFFDLKLGQGETHRRYTGKQNKIILDNLNQVAGSTIPYHIRIPLIPVITDTETNLNVLKDIICSLPRKPVQIDLLPYNMLAGGKYPSYGLEYSLSGGTMPLNENAIQTFIDGIQTTVKAEVLK